MNYLIKISGFLFFFIACNSPKGDKWWYNEQTRKSILQEFFLTDITRRADKYYVEIPDSVSNKKYMVVIERLDSKFIITESCPEYSSGLALIQDEIINKVTIMYSLGICAIEHKHDPQTNLLVLYLCDCNYLAYSPQTTPNSLSYIENNIGDYKRIDNNWYYIENHQK